MRNTRYLNASEVLAPEILAVVCEAVRGKCCLLWVPSRGSNSQEARNRQVVRLYEQGYSAQKVASQLFVSERTVWRILAKAKAAKAPAASAADHLPQDFDR